MKDEDGNLFAVKLLDPAKATKERVKRFRNEITFSRRNQHPNIVTVFDEGLAQHEGRSSIFYVMPHFEGSLRELMSAGIDSNDVLPKFTQILDGIEAAHLQKVVHRDLKPENVLFDSQEKRIVVADFGIARFEEEELFTLVDTKENQRLANFQYAAPEQRRRGAGIDKTADIFSLGLILNEMFTGTVPGGTGYRTIASVAPEYAYLDEIVEKMIRQDPADRPVSIEAIKMELSRKNGEFLSLQRLSELKKVVISSTAIDDPLVDNPPVLSSVDYKAGGLILKLSRPVNAQWMNAFHNMGSYECVMHKEPQRFHFMGDAATIPAEEREVQQIVDFFKTWLTTTNHTYRNNLAAEHQAAEDRKRRELASEIAEQEKRQRVLKNLRL